MNFQTLGRELEQFMFEYRNKGNGSADERRDFLKEEYEGAFVVTKVSVLLAPISGVSQQEMLDRIRTQELQRHASVADEMNYSAQQKEEYLEVHRRAYDDVAKEFGLISR